MYKTILSLGALAAMSVTVSAHGTVTGVTIDGQFIGGFKLDYYYQKQQNQPSPAHIGWYAENTDNGFIAPSAYNAPDIICHKNASPQGSSDTMAKVAAGGTVEFHWTAWPSSHVGPVITYVAPYTGDIASVQKTDLKWTKIQANGYENGQWAAIKMIGENNTFPVTVPSSLKAGKYVFRHEIIALHSAQAEGGAQNYPQCLNIEVTGSGTESPAGTAGESLYTPTEDGIIFNPYVQNIKYDIPGPALFGSSGSSNSSATTPTTPTTSNTPSTPSTPTTSGKPASAPSKSAAPAAASSGKPESYPTASPAPSSSTGGSSDTLPKEFTIEQFIKWLEAKTANSKARRHARALF